MKATRGATYIDGRNDGDYMVLLYQLDGFYIEVYFDQKGCFISSFRAFEEVSQLDPYLKTIKIDSTT
jgi:hypothetical protein